MPKSDPPCYYFGNGLVSKLFSIIFKIARIYLCMNMQKRREEKKKTRQDMQTKVNLIPLNAHFKPPASSFVSISKKGKLVRNLRIPFSSFFTIVYCEASSKREIGLRAAFCYKRSNPRLGDTYSFRDPK